MELIWREVATLIGQAMARRWIAEQRQSAKDNPHQSVAAQQGDNSKSSTAALKPSTNDMSSPPSNE